MSAPTHTDVFTEVINSLIKELSLPTLPDCVFTFPTRVNITHHLITNNLDSPILAEIHHLSLIKLTTSQTTALLPVLSKTTSLVSLGLMCCDASPDHIKFLFAECPALSKLQSLDLTGVREVKSPDLLLLSQSTTLTNLTSLNLQYCNIVESRAPAPQSHDGFVGFGGFDGATVPSRPNQAQKQDSSGLIALLSSPVVKILTYLNLEGTPLDDPLICITIATSPYLSNMVSLDLSYITANSDWVAALVASTTLINLTHLGFNSALRGELATQLFSTPTLFSKKFQSIDLGNNNITVSSLKALHKASPHLTELILAANQDLGLTGAQFIATQMPNLTKLDLSYCNIKSEGYAALAASKTLSNLRELDLNWNDVEPESIIALINSPIVANLTHLDLGLTHQGPQVLIALAQSPYMSKLEHLRFRSNKVGDEGIIALANSTTLTNLTLLDLGWNAIGPRGVHALCTSSVVSKLTHLSLENNVGMGHSIASALTAPTSTLYNLVELDLRGTQLGDEDVLQLLGSPNLDQLDSLFVSLDSMSDQTKAAYLARFDIHPDQCLD